jgi:hypothetical protein
MTPKSPARKRKRVRQGKYGPVRASTTTAMMNCGKRTTGVLVVVLFHCGDCYDLRNHGIYDCPSVMTPRFPNKHTV